MKSIHLEYYNRAKEKIMRKILIADDDRNFLKVLQHILKKHGYQVVACPDGETALKQMGQDNYMAVITDFKMGRISGLRVARTARSKNPPIPVFILSAYAEGLLKAHAEHFWGSWLKNAGQQVFAKPFDEPTLIGALKNLESDSRPSGDNQKR